MSAERIAFEHEVKELEQRWKVRNYFIPYLKNESLRGLIPFRALAMLE